MIHSKKTNKKKISDIPLYDILIPRLFYRCMKQQMHVHKGDGFLKTKITAEGSKLQPAPSWMWRCRFTFTFSGLPWLPCIIWYIWLTCHTLAVNLQHMWIESTSFFLWMTGNSFRLLKRCSRRRWRSINSFFDETGLTVMSVFSCLTHGCVICIPI